MLLIVCTSILFFFEPTRNFLRTNPEMIYFFTFGIIAIVIILVKFIPKAFKDEYKDYISLENVPYEFENLYESLYKKNLHSFELIRKKLKNRIIIQNVALTLFFIKYLFAELEIVIISEKVDVITSCISLIALIIGFAFLVKNNKDKRKYKEIYKKEIISNFIKLVNSKLEYKILDTELIRTKEDYQIANFDNKPFNRFYSDDHIEGFIDEEIFMKMCDLHIQRHTGKGKNSNTEEIFQGIFAHTKCNKDIETYIKISKNKFKILN